MLATQTCGPDFNPQDLPNKSSAVASTSNISAKEAETRGSHLWSSLALAEHTHTRQEEEGGKGGEGKGDIPSLETTKLT